MFNNIPLITIMEKVTKGLTNWLNSEGMTQKDVAEKLGVSEQFVNALFNGRREFGKKTANDWLHPLAAQKASSLAFASSLTLTDFELCRHFSNKIKKKIQKRNKKRGYAYFG